MSKSPKNSQQRKSETGTCDATKALLGQFMTPAKVARFMVSLFPESNLRTCRLLDPGAGVGSLTCTFLDRWDAGNFAFGRVEAEAYEIDDSFRTRLKTNLADYAARLPLETQVVSDDFINHAANRVSHGEAAFTHAILNPPYKKINSGSHHRLVLRRIGIETVNLYSAFVALALAMLSRGGHLVAIIPRSFCNGPYYRPFRLFIFERAAIRHIHLFEARDKAFKEDGVLQENVVLLLERGVFSAT